MVQGAAQVEKVALRVVVVEVATTKVEEEPDRIRVYDSWGCPGATRETRDVLESPFCCSRTSVHPTYPQMYLPTRDVPLLYCLRFLLANVFFCHGYFFIDINRRERNFIRILTILELIISFMLPKRDLLYNLCSLNKIF